MKKKLSIGVLSAFAALLALSFTSMKMEKSKKETGAYLEITLMIKEENRAGAAGVYLKYKKPFLDQINGAVSKDLLIRSEDVQVLHGFESEDAANAYLTTDLFENDVVRELKPFLESNPDVRIYNVFKN